MKHSMQQCLEFSKAFCQFFLTHTTLPRQYTLLHYSIRHTGTDM